MKNKDQVIKHLEMIQGVINRLGSNSFMVKGWSMAILATAILFMSRDINNADFLMLCFLIPALAFWILDGYFLWQERLFRGIYNDVREQETTDFFMNIPEQMKKPKCKWHHAIFSVTLVIFYLMEIGFILSAFFILNYIGE